VIRDTAQHIGEPSLRIDFVQFCGFNEGEGDCHGFAPALRTGEHPIFPAKGHWFDCALASVVIQFQKAIVEIGPCFGHPAQSIANGFCQR